MRRQIMQILEGLFGFGRVTATKQATQTKQVLASIAGNESEERPYQSLWGHAAIVYRPPADTEVIYVRMGEEMVPIASRDVRFSIDVDEGEVVIRNLRSGSPARIRLREDGQIVLEGGVVRIVDAGDAYSVATKALALAESVDNRLSTVATKFDNHTHLETGATTDPVLPAQRIGALASVASNQIYSKG